MSDGNGERLGKTGWWLDADTDAGELRFEHPASGNAYVFDERGNLTVPGDASVDGGLGELRAALSSAFEGEDVGDVGSGGEDGTAVRSADTDGTERRSKETAARSALQTAASGIDREETTDAVTIQSDTRVSMRAPTIEISGRDRVDVSSNTAVNVFEEEGVASIGAFPDGAASTDSVHRVEAPVGSGLDGATLSTVTVDYPSDFDVSGVTADDVLGAGVERTDGTIVFVDVSEAGSSDGGTAVTFNVSSDITIGAEETIILEYRGVTNASTEGDYVAVVAANGTEIGPGTVSIGPETDTPDPVVSTFEEDDDGWEISGDAQGGSTVPTYEDGTGTPAPAISAVDDVAGGVWYFKAPGKFLADKSAFYGGTLEYDLLQEYSGSRSQFDSSDIVLSGGGMTLTYDHGDTSSHPGGGDSGIWTSYAVNLDETDAWEKSDGSSPSGPEMQTVLGDLTELRIRGEYRSGSDKGYLDSVRMTPGSEGSLTLALADGTVETVAAVETDGSAAAYYDFDTANERSANLPDSLMVEDATVSFVHRNAATGEHSLVTVHDEPTTDTGGAAVMSFSGVSGAEWLVQDGPPGNDSYATPDDTFGTSEAAAWTWNSDRTDGGVIGPLGASFDVVISHRASGTVSDETAERSGLDRWLFVDGADPANPIELASLADGAGDVGARITTGDIDTSGSELGDAFGGLKLLLNGDTAVATAEGNVEAWNDATENGFDFTQSDSAKRPTLIEDAINGHPALRFDGEDDRFIREGTLGIPNDSARTFIVVCKLTDPAARSPYLMHGKFDATGTDSNAYGLEANTFNTAGERFGLYLISVAKDSERATDTNYNVHVLRTADASSLSAMEESTTYYVNGEQVPFTDTEGGVRNSPLEADSTAIGSFPQSSPGVLMHGEIAEIFVFDRAVTDEERTTLEAALFEKYGLGT